eukprot:TRINITY_DN16975_c0_g1_i1.p2 TRINITY_DN16975_c0_g1~~TRINITY_DN16975_c0_g1_i1.p2  ORF type:complete len:126 (+),score=45.66 TRINITY_DN16975_c0_g1_i1:3-380(+)
MSREWLRSRESVLCVSIRYVWLICVFFFSSRRRHTRCREVSWARRCVQETGRKRKKIRFPQQRRAKREKRQIEKEQKKQDEPKADELDRVSQEEQMMEAAMTEQANIQSLMLLQQIELTLTLIHI